MAFIKTDYAPLLGFYALIAAVTFALKFINPSYQFAFLGSFMIFLGFVLWLERPFIPIIRKNPYLAILASVVFIFLGLVISCSG